MKMLKDRLLLFCCILDFGKGSKLLKLSQELGGMGETVFLGKGTVSDEWLNILGILETRKEIFLTIINGELEDSFYDKVTDKFSLDKPKQGIAFSMPLKYCLEVDRPKIVSNLQKGDVKKMDYESIFVIVDKSSLDDVLEAAEAAGSTGGTVIHGRGGATQEKIKLFDIEIEPEKVIVLILSKVEKTEIIVTAIEERLNINEPGAGIIFVMDVSRTLGLYEE